MSQVIQLPEEVSHLINIISERWGYYFGKRSLQSQLMRATKAERATVAALSAKISAKISEFMESGADVRGEIIALQQELAKAKAVLSQKAEPFYAKTRPLGKVISYLDKQVIPITIEKATGQKLLPRTEIDPKLLEAIAPKK